MKITLKGLIYFFSILNLNVSAQTIIKSFKSQNSRNDIGTCVLQAPNGEILIAGRIKDTVLNNPVFTGFLAKLDSGLNIIWAREYDSGFIDITSIAKSYDNGYLLTGWYAGQLSSLLLRTDSLGNAIWSKVIPGNGILGYCESNNSGYAFIVQGLTSGNPQYSTVMISKTDSMGGLLWNYVYSSSIPFPGQVPYSIKQTLDNGFIITGFARDTTTTFSSVQFILKVDSNGNFVWGKSIKDSDRNYGCDIVVEPDSSFTFAAYSGHCASIIRTDKDGNILWSKKYSKDINFNDYQECSKIVISNDGGYFLIFRELIQQSYNELLKIDSVGNVVWTKKLNDNEIHTIKHNLISTSYNRINVISSLFDNKDIYVASIDVTSDSCTINPVTYFSTSFTPTIQNITYSKSSVFQQNIVITATNNLTLLDSVICSTPITSSVSEINSDRFNLDIFPNPFTTKVSINIRNGFSKNALVSIVNMMGQKFLSEKVNLENDGSVMIDASNVPSGIYIIQIMVDGEKMVKNLIKS